jgi:hypothetical protein
MVPGSRVVIRRRSLLSAYIKESQADVAASEAAVKEAVFTTRLRQLRQQDTNNTRTDYEVVEQGLSGALRPCLSRLRVDRPTAERPGKLVVRGKSEQLYFYLLLTRFIR